VIDLCICVDVFFSDSHKTAHMIFVPVHKRIGTDFQNYDFFKLLVNFLDFRFKLSLRNSLNRIPTPTFDRQFLTLGELMPLDGFVKQRSYLGRQTSSRDNLCAMSDRLHFVKFRIRFHVIAQCCKSKAL